MRFDQLHRREFITLIGGAAVAWPLAARAQQPKVPTIGALVIGNINPEMFWREFRQGLRDLGYVEGQNIRFEFRSAEGHLDRLPELAAELVRLKVDIIVTWFTPTALAAKQATHEIPIVMAETGDPVGTGLVASLPRPGGNVTGMAAVTAELAGKSVQLIRDMLPSARRVTALANATDPFSKPFLEQIKLGGEATGTTINPGRWEVPMPWKESSVMEERLRFVARLLDGETMTDVCREFGISRKTGYKIFDRYKEHGLEALNDRSRRPVRYANQLPEQLEGLIVRLKREKPHWGARKKSRAIERGHAMRTNGEIKRLSEMPADSIAAATK